MKTITSLLYFTTITVFLAGCSQPPSNNYLERQLIPSTGRIMPKVKGSQYDCSIASAKYGAANVWQANVGGRVLSGNQPYNVSSEACFPTQIECERFLYLMNGILEQIIVSRCQLGHEKSLFDKLFGS